MNYPGTYLCSCPPDFTGGDCGQRIDACQDSPCQNGGRCTDGFNSFVCDCEGTGYTGPLCTFNIDECALETHKCLNGGQCVDTDGNYTCTCTSEFTGRYPSVRSYFNIALLFLHHYNSIVHVFVWLCSLKLI